MQACEVRPSGGDILDQTQVAADQFTTAGPLLLALQKRHQLSLTLRGFRFNDGGWGCVSAGGIPSPGTAITLWATGHSAVRQIARTGGDGRLHRPHHQ